jgi:hypothetical protein
MKKTYLSLLFIAATFSTAFSQSISGGIRAGMNIANLSSSQSTTTTDPKIGLMAGAYLTIMVSEKFGVQPELVYSQMGASGSNTQNIAQSGPPIMITVKADDRLNYLSLPVLVRYNLTENFSLQVGPQLGFLLAATENRNVSGVPASGVTGITNGSSTVDIKDQITGINFGAAFGLGVDFGKFNAGARYYLGFSNLLKDVPPGSNAKVTDNAIQVVVGYTLFGKE